jgi:carboxy-cis,cis-muconate cyclase
MLGLHSMQATFHPSQIHPANDTQHLKTNMYGASLNAKRIASYSINNNLILHLENTINATGDCDNKTSAFVLPSLSPPYTVYTGSWPGPKGCGMGISVFPNGTLSNVTQTWKFNASSGIHGLAMGRNLYTADLSGDAIWTHKVHLNGSVEAVASYPMPEAGMHPRHVAAHPGGKYVYVVMEAGNEVVVYSVDDVGVIEKDVGTYSLIPDRMSSFPRD